MIAAGLAAAPLGLVLAAMALARWSALRAGLAGLACALAVALAAFDIAPGHAPLPAAAGVLAEAAHNTTVVLWIILPALTLYELQSRTGALERMRDALAALTADRRLQAVLVAWFFGLFMEGAAGFGTPVALAAPLLVGLGFAPVQAVALALVGHAAGVSFGAVGTPALTQVALADLDPRALAAATAGLHAALCWILALALMRIAGDGALGRAAVGWALFAAACFALPALALAALTGPELATLGAAIVGLAAFAARLPRDPQAPAPRDSRLAADLLPYGLILSLVLATRLIPPLAQALAAPELAWNYLDTFSGSFRPLYHPGTLLAAGLGAGALLTGRATALPGAAGAALVRLVPVAAALMVMLTLSRLMVHSGMIDTLAGAAAGIGPAWPLLVPAVGVLGTFVTGSATASNVLFTDFQIGTAAALGLPATAMAAGQGFGAAIGNVIAPHNIIAGAATVGLAGAEGRVLARTARVCLIYAAAGGAVLLAVAALA